MKLTDLNLLLYAVDSSAPRHRAARRWLEERLSGTETFAFAWAVLLGFVRLSTNPRVFEEPLAPAVAFDIVDGWLAHPCSTVVHPTERHSAVLRELIGPLGTAGNLTTDAHLAALSIEHGAELCSSDSDFSRFAGVRWVDPLRAS
ncbi:MAG TPA: type II toxin-antitoxin system VapC family toxin [Candidatus Limnocylindria bacterium]|nr:type II toxin-antitoxin system VapC family toxin [Candidatus Limnocylindria bacterium]